MLRPQPGATFEQRALEVAAADGEAMEALRASVSVLLDALRCGAFVPRVETPRDSLPHACSWCAVREACRRDDSGFRRRLVASIEAAPTSAAARLWALSEGTAP